MELTQRERYITLVVVAIVGVFVLDRFVLSPLLTTRAELKQKRGDIANQLAKARETIQVGKVATRRLNEMAASSIRRDRSDAGHQTMQMVSKWAEDARLKISINKGGETKENGFQKVSFRVTGLGSMREISAFLQRFHNPTIPVRITDLALTAHKEGADDLNLQLGFATIYLAPETENKPSRGPVAMGRY